MKTEQSNATSNACLLDVKGLNKSYKGFQLQDVDLKLRSGEIMGFMGKNGAGKSTTIQAIMDLVKPDSGRISILGKSMANEEIAVKDQVGYVSDTPILNSAWTAGYTLDFVRPFYSHWNQQLEEKYLKQFHIPLNKKVGKLSKGVKVKLSLILAICHEPKLLLLDEPTSGLDPVVREQLLELLLEFMQDESRSILFSSHITSDIEKIADVVTMIDDGKILLSEEKEALLDRWRRIIIFGEHAQEMKNDPKLRDVRVTAGGYIGYTDDFHAFAAAHADSGAWHGERLTLEELFVLLTGGKEE